MKRVLLAAFLFTTIGANAQYYYKDVLGTKESAELIATYRSSNVQHVMLSSYTIENTPLTNLAIVQDYLPDQQALRTTTQSDYTSPSYLTSYTAGGRIVKTTDSANNIVNTSVYTYTAGGKLASIITTAGDTLSATRTESHLWQYNAKGGLVRMLRIKNNDDTTYVNFKLDAAGNVTEEQESHYGAEPEPWLYYYDAQNRLTDIVRYNKKARKLLPAYLFYYSATNQVTQRYTIPENSDDYLIWRYQYNDKGLKTKEVIYNKQKELTGRVEYEYSFSR